LRQFWRVAVVAPLAIAAVLGTVVLVLPDSAGFRAVLFLALALGWVQNVASVLRVWGHVALSMLLRDGLPLIALGSVALWPASAELLILRAAAVLWLTGLAALAYGVLRTRSEDQVEAVDAHQGHLWLSSVLGMGQAQVDLVVAGLFLAPEVFGLYALMRRVVNLVAVPVSVAAWTSAGPISAAFSQKDRAALARAAAEAAAVAWYPALGLAACGLLVAGVAAVMGHPLATPEAFAIFLLLLVGALLQAYWAATYPLANLGPATGLAVTARALSLAGYGAAAVLGGAEMGAAGHALAFTVAMSLGSWHLWRGLRRSLGVDASARVLWHRSEAVWRTV
jgi:O-antigen/teichoic acid export membrane protein